MTFDKKMAVGALLWAIGAAGLIIWVVFGVVFPVLPYFTGPIIMMVGLCGCLCWALFWAFYGAIQVLRGKKDSFDF